ncbi:MAG: asparagine synthase-related protein [Bacteroidota bacterium]|nr:asparagine synthase-related protein [Bacteroidota bacterium]
MNGIFSLAICRNNQCFIYSAPGGFHSIYYKQKSGNLQLSENIHDLTKDEDLCEEHILEYLCCLHCRFDHTFYKTIFVTEPGIAICYSQQEFTRVKIFSYAISPDMLYGEGRSKLITKGHQMLKEITQRMIAYLDGRQAVIPLSGGYDSRLIITSLVKEGYKNILAFTYGKPDNYEISYAEQTARKLGVKWVYIPYYKESGYKYVLTSGFKEYVSFLTNGRGFPSMHEVISIQTLMKEYLSDDAVFIPGHSGDVLGGSQFVKVFPLNLKRRDISKTIISSKFYNYPTNRKFVELETRLLDQQIEQYDQKLLPATIFEDIHIAEKLSKHILNSSRAFSFFGYDSYFPYWDLAMIKYFRSLPTDLKVGKIFYDELLDDYCFREFGVDFKNRILNPSLLTVYIQNKKEAVKNYLPNWILDYFNRKNDIIQYNVISDFICNELEKNGYAIKCHNNYNAIISQYVIYCLLKSHPKDQTLLLKKLFGK